MDMLLLYKSLLKTLDAVREVPPGEAFEKAEEHLLDIMDDVWHSLTPEQMNQYHIENSQ